ncbi:F-BAR and double SH3 domains protein 2-like isoform X2 [Lates japonicus]|uniref:F-BAR and double SH3 domains protein 2-like isoform X2 n=1 Tax=Lates japonicus TaxID=270547 RepID=A0AAD3NN81_LATJO|nr:F-BAR and double SH3 domains protein 2-like isoform X2 [Lates japonicus]
MKHIKDVVKVMQLQKESGTAEEHSLDKEARKWASRVAREYKSIIHTQRALEEYGTQESSEQYNSELETKMEVARQSLRRAETVKVKAEARLDLLRQAGVAVETWLKSAMNQVMEELENERWNNLSTHDPSLSGTADLEREDEEEMEDSGEVLDDSSSSPSSTLKNYPLTCKVLYSYKAPQPRLTRPSRAGNLGETAADSRIRPREIPAAAFSTKVVEYAAVSLAALTPDPTSSNSTQPEPDHHWLCQRRPGEGLHPILSRETHDDARLLGGEFNGVVGMPFLMFWWRISSKVSENGDGQRDADSATDPRSPFQPGLHSSPFRRTMSSSGKSLQRHSPPPSDDRLPSQRDITGRHQRHKPFQSPAQGPHTTSPNTQSVLRHHTRESKPVVLNSVKRPMLSR